MADAPPTRGRCCGRWVRRAGARARVAAVAPPAITDAPAPPPPEDGAVDDPSRPFAVGDNVRLVGLLAMPGINGRTGVVTSLQNKSGRFGVSLVARGDDPAIRSFSAKAENLRREAAPAGSPARGRHCRAARAGDVPRGRAGAAKWTRGGRP